jgi:crossover junction endodeoxyribonuclease RuvC
MTTATTANTLRTPPEMTVMALDLATCTGFCFGPPDLGLPQIGHVRLPSTGADVGRFLIAFEEWLTDKIREVEPTLLLFEAPILASSATPHVTRKLHALAGITEMVAIRAKVECCEAYPVTVKKALTGSGRADKDQMVAAARVYGLNPAVPDEADAFGLWLHAVRMRHPKLAGRWDPLNFQHRRAA